MQRWFENAPIHEIDRVLYMTQVVNFQFVADPALFASFHELGIPSLGIREQKLTVLMLKVKRSHIERELIGDGLDIEKVHALVQREWLALFLDIFVSETDSVPNLSDHSGAPRHDAVNHLAIDIQVGGGNASWIAYVHMCNRGAGIEAILKRLDDVLRLFGQRRISFAAMQAARGRYGDDHLARVRKVGFHGVSYRFLIHILSRY